MNYDPIDAAIEPHVTKFNSFSKLATEHIIGKGVIVVDVANAQPDKIDAFCGRVRLKRNSTFRKYHKIGTEAHWLLQIADSVPANWTTIYNVAVLGRQAANEMVRDGALHPEVTASELKAAITATGIAEEGAVEDVDEFASACVFTVEASALCEQGRLELYCELMQSAQKYGLTVNGLPEELSERIIIEREAA